MSRRLVATDQDEQRLVQDLVVRELVPVDLGVGEDAHEVVAGTAAARLDRGGGELAVPGEGGEHLVEQMLVRCALAAHQVVRPLEQRRVIFGGDPERVADHDEREPRREVADEVHLAALAHGVDQGVDHLDDARLLGAHPRRREALVDQPPPAEVLRVVEVDHHRRRSRLGTDPPGVREDLWLALHGLQVVVAGDPPDPAGLVPVHRVVGPEPGELPLWVAPPELAARNGNVEIVDHAEILPDVGLRDSLEPG